MSPATTRCCADYDFYGLTAAQHRVLTFQGWVPVGALATWGVAALCPRLA